MHAGLTRASEAGTLMPWLTMTVYLPPQRSMTQMPPIYTYDHIHLRTTNPQATLEFYQKMFDATPVAYVQSNGQPRVDLDLNGLTIFIAAVPADATLPTAPSEP